MNAGDHLSGNAITGILVRPTRTLAGRAAPLSCLALLPAGFAWPATLLPLPVVSYTTVSPSLAEQPPAICLSVALAIGLPRPAVSRRRALWSADFPQQRAHEHAAAITRPAWFCNRSEVRWRMQVCINVNAFAPTHQRLHAWSVRLPFGHGRQHQRESRRGG